MSLADSRVTFKLVEYCVGSLRVPNTYPNGVSDPQLRQLATEVVYRKIRHRTVVVKGAQAQNPLRLVGKRVFGDRLDVPGRKLLQTPRRFLLVECGLRDHAAQREHICRNVASLFRTSDRRCSSFSYRIRIAVVPEANPGRSAQEKGQAP